LQAVRAVIEYSLDLEELSEKPGMPQGLGKVTIHGGKMQADNRSRDLRDVFRYFPPPSSIARPPPPPFH